MKTERYIASAKSAATFKLIADESLIAKVRRIRRYLCIGEEVRKAA